MSDAEIYDFLKDKIFRLRQGPGPWLKLWKGDAEHPPWPQYEECGTLMKRYHFKSLSDFLTNEYEVYGPIESVQELFKEVVGSMTKLEVISYSKIVGAHKCIVNNEDYEWVDIMVDGKLKGSPEDQVGKTIYCELLSAYLYIANCIQLKVEL